MTPLKAGRSAAAYFQKFVRAHTDEYAELMQGVNPNQGYGRSDLAHQAHDIATMLYHYTDEHFKNCFIPDNYASPEHFRTRLASFRAMLSAALDELRAGAEANPDAVPETVGWVYEAVEACRFAVDETVRLLGPAEPPPERGQADAFEILETISQRFPSVVERMKKRRAPAQPLTIENEYDVQFLFQGLAALYFDDIRPEEPGPSVAGGSSRADTLLRVENVMVEFKMTRAGMKDTDLRKQLADDFVLYAEHPHCRELFVFIYDPSKQIENRAGFESDMSKPRPPLLRVHTVVQQG
jgi:hypothetical protein